MTRRMGYLVAPLMTFALVGAGALFASAADARGSATGSAKVHNQQVKPSMKGGGGGGTVTPKAETKKSKEMKKKEMKHKKENKEMQSR